MARDYSQPVQFTITAPDGTKVVYTVTVKGNSCGNTPAPAPAPAPTTKTCPTHSYGTTGYELVFKSCDTTTGNNLFYDKTECVRDNSTGLIWQGQTPAGTGLRANDQHKTNMDSTTLLQKWKGTRSDPDDGSLHPILDFEVPTEAEVNATTNAVGYKAAVNATNLCGSATWRLPTIDELLTIVKTTEPLSIDSTWFPNTVRQYYWTSTPYEGDAYLAITVLFGYDGLNYGGRFRSLSDNDRVRLVR